MKERPILFSGPMVRAILDGRKTQTRRIAGAVKHPDLGNLYEPGALVLEHEPQHVIDRACPFGQPGDRLWVRETWGLHFYHDETNWDKESCAGLEMLALLDRKLAYRADWQSGEGLCHWRPSIHMPRWASRIFLEITSVRIERLQEISETDAIAEGWNPVADDGRNPAPLDPRSWYRNLWDRINGPDSWGANPWVWVINFKRVTP